MSELNEILANSSDHVRALNMPNIATGLKSDSSSAGDGILLPLEGKFKGNSGRARNHPEKDLEQFVHDAAKTFGLLYYHTYRSRFSEPGFPDCFIIGRYMLVAELKDTGKNPTPAQQAWLDAFKVIGVPTLIWRPEDREEIFKTLARIMRWRK